MPRKIITAGLKLGDQTVLGFQGPPGKDGAQGPTGKTGAQGPQGPAGSTPSFSIGTVSTLPAGSSATASITGSSSNPVLNLGIPRGATGAPGSGGSGGSGSSGSGSYVTVEAFGAVGDGVTDDTAAFTAALAYGGVVVCTKDAYYFAGTVKVPGTWNNIVLDLNGALLINFHLAYNMNSAGNDWDQQYMQSLFIIKNGSMGGSDWNNAAKNWQTPLIKAGGPMKLVDLTIQNAPYLMAIADEYIDQMEFTRVCQTSNASLFSGKLTLDGINYIERGTGTVKRISDAPVSLAGDSWVFTACNEWRFEGNSNYKLVRTCRNNAATFINCIQSSVEVGLYSKAVFIGCHWEEGYTMPTVSNQKLYLGSATFIGCYFWGECILWNYPNVTYVDCFVRQTYDNLSTSPLAYTSGNLDWDDLECKLIHLGVGGGRIVDTEELKRRRYTPKRTYNALSSSRTSLSSSGASVSSGAWGGSFSSTGNYSYKVYLLATSYTNLAVDSATKSASISNKASSVALFDIMNAPGGYGVLVYRTSPNGTIHRALGWTDPLQMENINRSAQMRMVDYGGFAELQCGPDGSAGDMTTALPWVQVSSAPSLTVNNKLYEAGGVLVTTDNSAVSVSGAVAVKV